MKQWSLNARSEGQPGHSLPGWVNRVRMWTWAEGLLCSCNARAQKPLVGHAQWETILAHPQGKR